MSTFSPTGPHGESTGDQAPGRAPSDNPLLAFGSEGEDPARADWTSLRAKSGQQRLAEMSWRAEEPAPSESTGSSSILERTVIPALVLACVLVAAFLYTEPVYSPIVLIDVAHPGAKADLIQPIPVPQPPATSGLHPAPSPATPPVAASTTATFGRGPISRPATPPATASSTTSRAPISRPAPPAPAQSDTAALNPPGPATVAGFGSLSINARPWADIWIDGQSAGQTPIANLQVALGTHEVLFRHPQLGERRRTVQVSNVAPTRISVDLRD